MLISRVLKELAKVALDQVVFLCLREDLLECDVGLVTLRVEEARHQLQNGRCDLFVVQMLEKPNLIDSVTLSQNLLILVIVVLLTTKILLIWSSLYAAYCKSKSSRNRRSIVLLAFSCLQHCSSFERSLSTRSLLSFGGVSSSSSIRTSTSG